MGEKKTLCFAKFPNEEDCVWFGKLDMEILVLPLAQKSVTIVGREHAAISVTKQGYSYHL